ncbi:OLC1v1036081C1 [Oldenlandia corymbosa var. corymbosa]|uniref:OLC1v1036081C1 n=1 Tax=Oldenlandia corymbosa var. corymbosa TaxID=529605 RepID=A0AAV1CVL1_OLDCO|nr:OLC1v1036081C1 [Oldenlandia corymbosa var. corymbosa]
MAPRQLVVVLGLVLFAVVGVVSASTDAVSPIADPVVEAPDNNVVGPTDGESFGAAPAGGPVSEGTFAPLSPAEAPKSGSTTLEAASTYAAGLVASAVLGSFFF